MRYNYTRIGMSKKRERERQYHSWQGCRASEIYTPLEGMQNDTAPLENSLTVSYKIENTIPLKAMFTHKLEHESLQQLVSNEETLQTTPISLN